MRLVNLLSLSVALGLVLAGSQTSYGSLPPSSKCMRLDRFNHIKVGDSIESLPSVSRERTLFGSGSTAQFYFYLFKSDLPRKCLNLQCGTFVRQVLARGGLLVGGADQGYAKEVGLNYESDAPGIRSSLLVVTDPAGKVTAIYRDFATQDLKEILASISN